MEDADSRIISEHIRVYCRQKPLLPEDSPHGASLSSYLTGGDREEEAQESCLSWNGEEGTCTYRPSGKSSDQLFKFDGVFLGGSHQQEIFEVAALPIVDSVLQGYSGTIFAYGPTGSGKTFTMRGEGYESDMGIIPRCLKHMLNSPMMALSEIWVSYLQIYCEIICDLLVPTNTQLSIRERSSGAVYVEGLSKAQISSIDDLNRILNQGDANRVVASTTMNAVSSRSHAALIVNILPKSNDIPSAPSSSKNKASGDALLRERSLILVDLSGSERASAAAGKYLRLEEAKSINLSLSSLGNCISALCDNRTHIPYRDSKLTRLLQGSLGGGARTSIIVNIPTGNDQNGEVISALRFAARAVKVQVAAKIQRFVDYEALYRNAQLEIDVKDQLNRNLELKCSRQEDKIEELESTIQSLRLELKGSETKLKWLEDQTSTSNGAFSSSGVDKNGSLSAITSSAIQDIIAQHAEDMEQQKRQLEKKVNAYKTASSQASQELSATQLEMQNEKQKHLETMKELRESREKLLECERAVNGRVNDLLSELAEKRALLDELQETLPIIEEQNIQLKETVSMLAGRLEEACEEMENMVSKEEVEKMEFMFSDTVTRLSTRVVQLENKHRNSEYSSNKKLDDCGGALDFDSLGSPAPTSKSSGARGAAMLQPGGRVRVPVSGDSSKQGSGLVYSASTESVLGGTSSSNTKGGKRL